MKRFYFFLMALMSWLFVNAQGEVPDFSTEGNPVWYHVKFQTGGAYLADKGADANLMTADFAISDEQMWQLIGTEDNFLMKNKAGRYVNFNGSRFTAASTGVELQIAQSQHAGSENYWEIHRIGVTDAMNQYGGAGAEKELGEWTVGDTNNSLSFIKMNDEIFEIFSTEAEPVWYQVQFKAGSACLADQGTGNNLKTANQANVDAQKWQFIGTPNSFQMKSKAGNYVNFSNSRFTAAATGVELKFVPNGESHWEIQRVGSSQCMNQHGSAGAGKELAEYNANDNNNPLWFILASAKLPKFSEGSTEIWYFILSSKGETILKDNGVGEAVRLAGAAPTDAMLWKLVGTKDNFQIINKLGHYAVISDQALGEGEPNNGGACSNPLRISETAYTGGFSLTEATNATYPKSWLIKPNSHNGGYFNCWGGTQAGSSIGLWTAKDDVNNAFEFIDPADVDFADFIVEGAASFTPENPLTLWYNQPATLTNSSYKWMEYSLPIGNGQLGACLFGGILSDEIQFNEKTLWQGGPNDYGGYGGYKNFGSVFVDDLSGSIGYTETDLARNYVRYLDIETATAGVKYTNADGSKSYERKYISSEPDQVIAAQYTASEGEKLKLKFYVKPGTGINASAVKYEGTTAYFGGKMNTVTYRAYFRVVPVGDDAVVETDKYGITVSNADAVTLIFSGGTDYDLASESCVSGTAELPAKIMNFVENAAIKGWDAIYSDHVENFKSYMGRTSFSLKGATSSLPTDELVKNYNNSTKNVNGTEPEVLFLEQLYFAYGRYLLISSSRGINVPNNLQGIWNDRENAPWNSDIHTNINIQMNYWPAEPTNLSDLHMPFLDYIITMAERPSWKAAATRAGQTVGWTILTETNIFGGMGSFGGNYLVANAWYCSHLWQHYRFTRDTDFLARAFPAMWSCVQFWMERMIEDKGYDSATDNPEYKGEAYSFEPDGTFVAPNEYSAEQNSHPSEDGTAHAQQLIYALLQSVKEANDILTPAVTGLSEEDINNLTLYLEKTDKGLHTEEYTASTAHTGGWSNPRNGVNAGDIILREWKYSPYDVSNDPGHRHMSHLMALYPLSNIGPNSEYFEPAVNSLKLRGDAATGWSMGWKVNLWARALDGDHAHIILKNALKHSTSYGTDAGAGGIYYNLFDSHAPFQIDGNFGVCSGVAEMLMQSHTDVIQILPALPSVWAEGEIKGLKAVGDFTVDIAWKSGKATRATIVNNLGQPLVVNYEGIEGKTVYVNNTAIAVETTAANTITIPSKAKDVVVIDFDGTYTEKLNDIAKVLGITAEEVTAAGGNVYAAAEKNYYRFTSQTNNKVIGLNAEENPAGVETSAKDFNQIWQIQPDGTGFKLAHPNQKAASELQGYLSGTTVAEATMTDDGEAQIYDIRVEDAEAGTFRIEYGTGNDDCLSMGDGYTFTCAKVEAIEVDLKTASVGNAYASLYLPYDITNEDAEAKAYVGGEVNNSIYLKMNEAESVKALNGFVMEAPAAKTVTLKIGATPEAKASSISGTTVSFLLDETNRKDYLLFGVGKESQAVGFYPTASSIAAVPANRAFYDNTTALFSAGLRFFDMSTGIRGTETSDNEAPTFDLSGRRVDTPAHRGVYIKGSKKIVVK